MDDRPVPAWPGVGLPPERHGDRVPIQAASSSLSAARRAGRRRDIEVALIRLAHLHFRQGRYGQTRKLAEEVLRDASADSTMRCDALRILGNCAVQLGDPDRAEAYYHEAMDLARELDYGYALYKCLHSLATNIYWPRGQFDLCLAAGKAALVQAQELDLGEELRMGPGRPRPPYGGRLALGAARQASASSPARCAAR